MSDPWTSAEQNRFEAMKHLRVSGYGNVSRMIPRLRELNLLSCPNCDDEKNQRRNLDGVMICKTCENTANHFWTRNRARLRADEADVLELKWEWIETKREIVRRCLERGDNADLRLASTIIDQLTRFGGLDIEFDFGSDDDDADVQNVPRGLAVKRPASRRDPASVN